MSNVVDLNAKHPLSGTWKCCDGFSDKEISIGFVGNTPSVVVYDKYDGEVPRVFEVSWDSERSRLTFSTLWSTGRFVKYQFTPSPKAGRAEVTFSYTDQEIWERL